MSIERVRLRKKLIPKIEQWSAALDISETEFVHEALTHYIRFLSGIPTGSNVIRFPLTDKEEEQQCYESKPPLAEMSVEEYDGGIAL